MTTQSMQTPLWWSENGHFRCRSHLPLPGSESWWRDGWTVLPPQDRVRITRLNRHPATCEVCCQHATGAHAAYLEARAAVAAAITDLVRHLDALDAAEDVDQRNWSYAASVNHVAAALRDLVPAAPKRRDG